MSVVDGWMEAIVLLAFNVPIVVVLICLPFVKQLSGALKERSPIGGVDDKTSYSRITGLFGAVIMASLFWAIGNVILYKMFSHPDEVHYISENLGPYFLSGAALFLPYACNQIRNVLNVRPSGVVGGDATPAVREAEQLQVISRPLNKAVVVPRPT